ncbi:MAG: MMPL family transporter, partial [Clostridia bacterium]|nr:MMPL family transporter [Clostridia bacterium]
MFNKIFKWNARLVSTRPKLILLVAFIVTIIAGFFATNLSMELSWVSMAPSDSPAVKEYEEILDNFPSLDSILILVESNNYDRLVEASRETAAAIAGLYEYVTSVVAGIETDFMLENALMLMDEEEAKLMGYAFYDANLTSVYQLLYMIVDETAEKAAEGTLTDEQIIYSASAVKGIESVIEQSNMALDGDIDRNELTSSMERIFVGDGILTSPDGKMAMITVQPGFDMMDEVNLIPGVNAIESEIKDINDQYADVTIRGTGMHFVARDEMVSIMNDSYLATILSIVLIILLLYFAFRTWLAPLFTVTPLIFGIIWAMGIVGLVIGRLNMFTVFAVAMLAGLGIDYSIHLFSSYTERRAAKIKKKKAMAYAICRTGPSIIVGALTTATAFFALNISNLKILSELGTVMGTGIVTTLVAVFWVLPAIITLKKEKKKNIRKISGNYRIIGRIAYGIHKVKYFILAVVLIGAGFMGYMATQVGFDMNLMNLEPKGLESIELMEHMVDKYDTSSTNLSVQADSLDEVFNLHKELEGIDGVAEVTSIVSVLPPMEDQKRSLDTAEEINDLLKDKVGEYPVDRIAL